MKATIIILVRERTKRNQKFKPHHSGDAVRDKPKYQREIKKKKIQMHYYVKTYCFLKSSYSILRLCFDYLHVTAPFRKMNTVKYNEPVSLDLLPA